MAVTVKLAGCPALTARSTGCAVTSGPAGAAFTVNFASALVTRPDSLVATARKTAPLSSVPMEGIVYQFEVAPGMSIPFLCH